VTALTWLGAALTMGLLAYLVAVMLKPEWFS
jgi:K+-transporting ATPase KdpF subunit